jgi:hypothetical protein
MGPPFTQPVLRPRRALAHPPLQAVSKVVAQDRHEVSVELEGFKGPLALGRRLVPLAPSAARLKCAMIFSASTFLRTFLIRKFNAVSANAELTNLGF